MTSKPSLHKIKNVLLKARNETDENTVVYDMEIKNIFAEREIL